jgi:hypothetical protein
MKEGREPWNFDAFVRHYNEIAAASSGWRFDGDISEEKLREWYEGAGSLWDSLRDFAKTRFELDQRM